MTTTYKELVKAVSLTASATSLYTAPSSTYAAIHAASANNPTGAPVTIEIFKVPTGHAADATTRIAAKAVAAGATGQFPELVNHKLEPGTQIFADGLGCSLNISGVEYVPGS
jgi:hypothetical protein